MSQAKKGSNAPEGGAGAAKKPVLSRNVICTGHSRPIPQMEFKDTVEDGLFLISACLDNRPMLRDGPTGDWIGSFVGHNGAVWCARLNSNATRAVTASADFTAKYWCAITGQMLHSFEHQHVVRAACFSKDDQKMFTAGREGKIRIFDLTKPTAEPSVCDDKGSMVHYLLNPSDSPTLVSSDDKNPEVKIWDTRTNKSELKLQTDDIVTDLCMSCDGTMLCGTAGKTVFFWDIKTLEVVKTFKMDRDLLSVAVDMKKTRFVVGSPDELYVRSYQFQNGAELTTYKGHHGPVGSLAFMPSGDFASGSVDGTIRIWRQTVKTDE